MNSRPQKFWDSRWSLGRLSASAIAVLRKVSMGGTITLRRHGGGGVAARTLTVQDGQAFGPCPGLPWTHPPLSHTAEAQSMSGNVVIRHELHLI